ncbi:MAG: NRDE family protein [Saprospiraceae bacterium]|nr:NRDE family protein [Saprospiraceae bacterium]
MCTVTFVPIQDNHYVLTSNRDESPLRSPEKLHENSDRNLIYPREPLAGGTWICISQTGTWVCLLNGAFVKHVRKAPYRRSRGLVVLDFFEYTSAVQFFDEYELDNIEPFTIIAWDQQKQELYDFRWDGEQRYLSILDKKETHIWSSCPLYPPEIQAKRKKWFTEFLANHNIQQAEEMLDFHHNAGEGDPENDLMITRYGGKLRTVSTTIIEQKESDLKISYNDLIHEKNSTRVYQTPAQKN